MMSGVTVRKAVSRDELEEVFAIRRTVFVIEQNCPPELEWEFEEESEHFLAFYATQAAGVCRWRRTENGYKLERFAVLKEFRGKKVGEALVTAVLADLPADADYVYLNAQVHAVPFYARFGFEKEGEMFEEAGISHYKMVYRK